MKCHLKLRTDITLHCITLCVSLSVRAAAGSDGCRSMPCRNNGTCRSDREDAKSSSTSSYKCFCLPPFTGDNCQFDAAPTAPSLSTGLSTSGVTQGGRGQRGGSIRAPIYDISHDLSQDYREFIVRLVAWHSGRTSVSGRRTFPDLRLTYS